MATKTISEELMELINTKKNILAEIVAKGVTTEASAPFSKYPEYIRQIGSEEPADAQEAFNILNDVMGTSDEYSGMGGTEEEILNIMNNILGEG